MTPPRPAPPAPRRRAGAARLARVLLWALPALGIALVLAVAGLAWLTRTDDGAAWLLARVPGLVVTAPRGSLGRTFEADRVVVELGGGDRIVLGQVHWEGLRLRRALHVPHWFGVSVRSLRVARVDVERAAAPGAGPARPPATLALPVEVDLPDVHVEALYAGALGAEPVRDLRAALRLGTQDAEGRDVHRIDDLALAFDRLAVRGSARIASQAPFDLAADLKLAPARTAADLGPLADFAADVHARGPLDWINLTAQLSARLAAGRADAAAPQLDVKAALLPFAAWPIGAFEATTRALDLSALDADLPATELTGTATLASDAASQPATLSIALDNAQPGRVDEGRLPVRRLVVDARARPDAPRDIELHGLDALLGSAARPAGHLHGDGRWHDGSARLELQLEDVHPNLLDARAPAMRLAGRTTLGAEDLAGAAARFTLAGRIDGALALGGRERRVLLQLDAAGDPRHVELHQARAEAGRARATLAGRADREADGGWRVRGQGSVADFDPSRWWPGREGSAWRQGPHRLDGRVVADLRWPARAAGWRALRGSARLDLADSVLAGVPLAGRVELAGAATPTFDASLQVAGAPVAARGRLGARDDDHWEVDARGADLARIAPLLRLAAADLPPLAGRLDLRASADGRWPALATQGQATLAQGRLGDARLARARLHWRIAGTLDAPLEVDAHVTDLALGADARERLSAARLQLQGTLAAQHITLDASAPVQPPAWLDALRDAAAPARAAGSSGSTLVASAQGGLDAAPGAGRPLHWQGRLQKLALRPSGSADAAPWLASEDVALDLRLEPGGASAVEAQPGRLRLPGAALQWSRLRWQGGAKPALDLQARLEPVAVAPLLARLQPDFGWRGDLVVGARIDVRSAPRPQAAVELRREGGDLSVTDPTGTLALGLTDLRLALDVNDGVWSFTQAFAGKTLGAMAAAATVRTDPARLWPAPDAPLSGVLEARVANLAAWSAWVPPGWRLGGMLHASASIGGRFGAPRYTGEIDGRDLAARNLIEGIDVHDGELAVSLDGDRARIERFVAHAGDGRVVVEGGATFGAKPSAQLQLVAERLRVLGRVDRRIVASGHADLALGADTLRLAGRFAIDEGLIDISRAGAPALGSDVRVIRPGQPAEAPTGPRAPARNLALDVTLDLGPQLRLRGRGIDTLLRGELHASAPNGRLALEGSVHTAEGHYAAYGQKLDIEHGLIAFAGAPDNPRLDIVAIRPDLDVRVGVAIGGTAQVPRVRLISEPEMSDVDKLSWLVLGRASEGLGSADTALLQRAALGLLAGERNGPDLTQRLGLDALSLRQQANGEVHETIVSLGKQLTRRWYVGYERGLSATAGTWQLIYRVAQRFTLRAQSGLDNSLDLIWTWRWQ